jgi:hypothetical protein
MFVYHSLSLSGRIKLEPDLEPDSPQKLLSCKVLKNLRNLDEFYRYLNFEKIENLDNFSKSCACYRCVQTKIAMEKKLVATPQHM